MAITHNLLCLKLLSGPTVLKVAWAKILILGLCMTHSPGMTAVAVSGSTTSVVPHRKEVIPTATKALRRRENGVMTPTSTASTPGNSEFYPVDFGNLGAEYVDTLCIASLSNCSIDLSMPYRRPVYIIFPTAFVAAVRLAALLAFTMF